MSKTDTIDLSLIYINPEIYPRAEIDSELVETYSQNMEAGAKFPPLVVQKDTYTLIDGVHRYHALKKLGKKKVRVEIRDIPDNELRAEVIRLNVKQGKRLTQRELRRSIIALRMDNKSLKEIAKIVGLTEGRISQIYNEFRTMPRYFNNFNSKVPKIDLKGKVDEKKKREIIADVELGLMSGKEIAESHNISPSLVSQIKKEHEVWKSELPVYIESAIIELADMFKIAFMNRILKKARFEFTKNGVVIRNSEGKTFPLVVAMFKDNYFVEYKVTQPIEGYARSDILTQIKRIDVDYEPCIELALVDSNTWKIRYEKGVKSHSYDDIGWRDFELLKPELDGNGIPKTCTVKAEISRHELPRNQKGELTLTMEGKELSCSFKCGAQAWDCNHKVKLESLKKNDDARAIVDLKTLDQAIKVCSGPFWIGMWNDRTQMALGQGFKAHKFCFII